MRTTTFSSLALTFLPHLTSAIPYTQTQDYSGANFYDGFNFITSDPSGGWVSYVDGPTAANLGYASADANGAYMGVDHTSVLSPTGPGRRAVRIESKVQFTKGLFIGDFSHMPEGCGTWPAFWMYGPNWPNSGEIDIIEGVNNGLVNQVSAHTGAGCVISPLNNARAALVETVCYQPYTNSGCYFVAKGAFTYGPAFNANGGGVYAMQWRDGWISIWFWRRGKIPAGDAGPRGAHPDPATWKRPMAMFTGSGCDIDNHFANMRIVLNTDFCGPWAGNTFAAQGCGTSCTNYVATNPAAFTNAFWHVNSIKVFTPSDPSLSKREETEAAFLEALAIRDAINGTNSEVEPTTTPSVVLPTSTVTATVTATQTSRAGPEVKYAGPQGGLASSGRSASGLHHLHHHGHAHKS